MLAFLLNSFVSCSFTHPVYCVWSGRFQATSQFKIKKLKSFFHWNSFIAKTCHQCNLQSVFFLPEIFQNKKVRFFFKLYEKWFLFVILSLCLGFFPLFFYFLLSTHLSFLDPLEGKKWNSCRRICIQFYRTESLGKGGSATLPVSLGASCSPLGETHSSSNQVTVMRLRENRLQFPSLLQKWKMGVNEFLHVANLQCFSSGLPGTGRACLSISPQFSGGAAGTKPSKELPTTLTPAEQIVVFLPSTEPIKLLLQIGNKSDYCHGQQTPVTCSCCLNILPQSQRKLLSCLSLTEAPWLVFQLQITHTVPSSPSIFFSLCRKHCTSKFYFLRSVTVLKNAIHLHL